MRRGDDHQPAQAQPRLRGDRVGQRRDVVGLAAVLAGFVVDVDLDQHVQRRAGRPADAGPGPPPAWPGRRSGPSRTGAAASLALFDCRWPIRCHSSPSPASAALLGRRFLHVVLAEGALAGRRQFRDGRRILGLADREQPRHWPSGCRCRVLKLVAGHPAGRVRARLNSCRKCWKSGKVRGLYCRAGVVRSSVPVFQSVPVAVQGSTHGYRRTSGVFGKEQSIRPAPFRRPAAHDPGRRRRPPHQHPGPGPQAGARAGLRHHVGQAAPRLRRVPRGRLLLRDSRPGAFPRQRLQPEPRRRCGVPYHSLGSADAWTTWAARRSSAN